MMRTWAVALTNKTFQFFVSLKLTFVLLLFIGIGAVIGMSFDQTVTFEEFYQRHPKEEMATFFLSFFELYDAFHSWWFSLAILLLAMNLIACSIERLPRIYFEFVRPRPYLTKRRMLGLPLSWSAKVDTEEKAMELINAFLPKRSNRARLKGPDGFFYCERASLARFGVYVVHVSLLIVMFSSIYATQNGVDGHVMIDEGTMARFITRRGHSGVSSPYDLGFYIGCEDFRLRTFVDNSPMEFESDLFISGDRFEKTHQKTVRVNEPLKFAGFTFYQASYKPIASEPLVTILVGDGRDFNERYRVRLNEPIKLLDSTVISVDKIYEDFAGLGQALRIKKETAFTSTYFHIFRRHRDYDRVVRNDRYQVIFLDADQKYATGLSVGKLPGIEAIFLGFFILLCGLFMCFFMTPVRYFARMQKVSDHIVVSLAAQGFRNPQAVKDMFHRRIKSLPI